MLNKQQIADGRKALKLVKDTYGSSRHGEQWQVVGITDTHVELRHRAHPTMGPTVVLVDREWGDIVSCL